MTPNQLPPLPSIHPVTDHPNISTTWTTQEIVWIHRYATDYALAALAQQAQPAHQFRRQLCADWYDGHPDHEDGGGPYETRILYTTPPAPQVPAPDIDEAAIARMTKRGADAWAGVDAQALREGEQVPAPVDEREAWLPIEADTVPDRSKPLFWLLVDGSPVLGYFVEIPFREIRDADGRYIDQQDADAFWATQATGDQVEPTHYCELMPPTAPQTKGQP